MWSDLRASSALLAKVNLVLDVLGAGPPLMRSVGFDEDKRYVIRRIGTSGSFIGVQYHPKRLAPVTHSFVDLGNNVRADFDR